MKRRQFLAVPVSAIGAVALSKLGRVARMAETGTVRVPLRFFTESEALIMVAATERIFPRDEHGAGATDAGVVVYIDRQLAGPYGRDKYRYTKAPWIESVPEHGYQKKDTPRDVYRGGLKHLGPEFLSKSPAEQDAALQAIENTRFFQLLRAHTLEGVFSDPMHGGNANLVGWKLIGYPGPRLSYRDEIEKHYGEAYRLPPMSLQQIVGRRGHPLEEEAD